MMPPKTRIVIGAYALGGVTFLSAQDIERIHTRPDEERRRAKLAAVRSPN